MWAHVIDSWASLYANSSAIRTALGFTTEQFKQLAPLVSFKDQVVRIVSVGRSGEMTRTVQMIVRKGGGLPQLINWKEI